MARYRKKKALYEVMSKSRFKPDHGREGEQQGVQEPGRDESGAARAGVPTPELVSHWRRRPRIVQFIGGRVEFSMPYPLAVALVLGIVLLVLFAYRLGEYSVRAEQGLAVKGTKAVGGEKGTPPLPKGKEPGPGGGAPEKSDVPLITKGDHRIVIQQFHRERDLVEVQRYYLVNGVDTEIEKRGDQYFLLTKETFENPERPGTDGAAAKKRIIEIGAGYKAPPGFDSFAPRLFSDAYGEKIRK